MKQRLQNITAYFLLLLILRGVLVMPLCAKPLSEASTTQLAPTTEEDFWQKFFKALVKGSESEKEEEKKENQRNSLKEKNSAHWKTHSFQAILFEYQYHLCSSHWHDWFFHRYLTIKAHRAHHLYLFYQNLKIPTDFIA